MKQIRKNLKEYFHSLHNGVPLKKNSARHLYDGTVEPYTRKASLSIILFILTFASTAYVGTRFFSPAGTAHLEAFLRGGLPYSISLLFILSCHEFGHFFAAAAFGVKSSYPYFIPFPSLIGTMGAVINIKSKIPNRRALLYIGASGPIAGFIASTVILAVGMYFSEIKPLPPVDSGAIVLGEPLLVKIIVYFMYYYIPWGQDLVLSPLAAAGWVGCLVTSINLMPLGQLDGGHILYAIAEKIQKTAGWTAFAALLVMSYFFIGWLIWIPLILIIIKVGHPPVAEDVKLSLGEKLIGLACIAILALTFIPVPIRFL